MKNSQIPTLEGFELFTEHRRHNASEPIVSIHAKGVIALNGAALDRMGQPEAVELLFNPERRVIALRPTTPSRTAVPVRFPNKGSRSAVVSAKSFLDRYGVNTEKATSLDVQFVGPVALLSLPEVAASDDTQ